MEAMLQNDPGYHYTPAVTLKNCYLAVAASTGSHRKEAGARWETCQAADRMVVSCQKEQQLPRQSSRKTAATAVCVDLSQVVKCLGASKLDTGDCRICCTSVATRGFFTQFSHVLTVQSIACYDSMYVTPHMQRSNRHVEVDMMILVLHLRTSFQVPRLQALLVRVRRGWNPPL